MKNRFISDRVALEQVKKQAQDEYWKQRIQYDLERGQQVVARAEAKNAARTK